MITSIVVILLSINISLCNKSFKYCNLMNDNKHINTFEMCKRNEYLKNFGKGSKNSSTDVLLVWKEYDTISGIGYKCWAKSEKKLCYKSFFGVETVTREDWFSIRLTPEQCWSMVNEKKCLLQEATDDAGVLKKMECNSVGCHTSLRPENIFKWLKTEELRSYECGFTPVPITGHSKNDLLYNYPCRANQFNCSHGDAIIVWNNTLFHSCPYKRIRVNTNYWDIMHNNVYLNKQSDLLIEIDFNNSLDFFQVCGDRIIRPYKNTDTNRSVSLNMYGTNQGLYLIDFENAILGENMRSAVKLFVQEEFYQHNDDLSQVIQQDIKDKLMKTTKVIR